MQRGDVGELKSFSVSWGLITVGSFIFLLAFFGCCGANRESRGMLKLYFALLVVFIAAQIALVVVATRYTSDLDDTLFDAFNDADTPTKNDIQRELSCCGFYNRTDSTTTDPNNICFGGAHPDYTNGCFQLIKDELKHYGKVAIGVGSAAAALQVLGLIFSCLLISRIGRKEDEEALLRDARTYNQTAYTTTTTTTRPYSSQPNTYTTTNTKNVQVRY